MRIWIISDAHLGKYSTKGDKWNIMMRSYFFDFLIPIIKENAKKDDKFFFLGDLFDNRIALDMTAINLAVEIFEELTKNIECHVLLGNHDQRMMKDPTINGIATIRNIKNLHTYSKPATLEINDLKIGMMPWLNGKVEEQEILKSFNGYDYVFCHSDLNGCRTQLYPTRPMSKGLLDIEDFEGIGRVFSGHIHIVQTINNFTFVGCPYHLDRNDVTNRKGIHVINTKNKKETFIENDFSPEFIKIIINKEKDLDKLKTECNNDKVNYIDVEISKTLLVNNPHIKLEIDKLSNKSRIERIELIDDLVVEDKVVKPKKEVKGKTIKDISLEYVNDIQLNSDVDFITELEFKKKLKEVVNNCFEILDTSKK